MHSVFSSKACIALYFRGLTHWPIMIFKLIPWTDISCAACKIVVRWIPQKSIDDKSKFVQVMAWCRQATSHYLNQCWPRSLPPYGITRPQWVNERGSSTLKYKNSRNFCKAYNVTTMKRKHSKNTCMYYCRECVKDVVISLDYLLYLLCDIWGCMWK